MSMRKTAVLAGSTLRLDDSDVHSIPLLCSAAATCSTQACDYTHAFAMRTHMRHHCCGVSSVVCRMLVCSAVSSALCCTLC